MCSCHCVLFFYGRGFVSFAIFGVPQTRSPETCLRTGTIVDGAEWGVSTARLPTPSRCTETHQGSAAQPASCPWELVTYSERRRRTHRRTRHTTRGELTLTSTVTSLKFRRDDVRPEVSSVHDCSYGIWMRQKDVILDFIYGKLVSFGFSAAWSLQSPYPPCQTRGAPNPTTHTQSFNPYSQFQSQVTLV